MQELNKKIKSCPPCAWNKHVASWKIKKSPDLKNLDNKIKEHQVIEAIYNISKGKAVITTKAGLTRLWTGQYFQFDKPRTFIYSGKFETRGFGLPAAHGAKIGAPDRVVIGIIGDGGFQMTIQELATINQTRAAVKIVLMNNTYLGMVRQWQQLFFNKRYSETHLQNPDFIKVAEGFGIKGRRITERSNLENGIEEMLSYDGSFLLEVDIEKEANVFPMVPAGASVSDVILNPE